MIIKNTNIFPKIGFDELRFGMYPSDVIRIIGYPEQSEDEDEDGDTIYRYDSKGIDLLCFDKGEDYKLTIIELNANSCAYLWNTNVFNTSVKTIKELSQVNGFKLTEREMITLGLPETMYQIKELAIDFHFNNTGKLKNISLSVFVNEFDQIVWPNL